jgi:hypothetical protein
MIARNRLMTCALLSMFCSLAACDRSHLTASHGRAYRQAFARQAVNPQAGATHGQGQKVQGLDSQEAATISKNYRRALSPAQSEERGAGQILMYSPRTGLRDGGNLPAPSVPQDR